MRPEIDMRIRRQCHSLVSVVERTVLEHCPNSRVLPCVLDDRHLPDAASRSSAHNCTSAPVQLRTLGDRPLLSKRAVAPFRLQAAPSPLRASPQATQSLRVGAVVPNLRSRSYRFSPTVHGLPKDFCKPSPWAWHHSEKTNTDKWWTT